MLFKKVIYISEGYFGTKAANSIQVTAMCNSFIKSGLNVHNTTCYCFFRFFSRKSLYLFNHNKLKI